MRIEFVLLFCYLFDLVRIKIFVLFNNLIEVYSIVEYFVFRIGIVGFRIVCIFFIGLFWGFYCKWYREIEMDNFFLMWELSVVFWVCNYRRFGLVFLVFNIVGLLFIWCVFVLLMELLWKLEDLWIFNL